MLLLDRRDEPAGRTRDHPGDCFLLQGMLEGATLGCLIRTGGWCGA